MSRQASFERFDYGLRSNKNIERKLVFDILASANQMIGFVSHQYLGFGSMWFSDFRIAHRWLGIDEMFSFEREAHAARAEFNKPFAGINVLPGDCLETLGKFSAKQWERPFVAWLDFDGFFDSDISSSLTHFVKNCAPNSILTITVNAHKNNYARGRAFDKRGETAVGVVEALLAPGVTSARFEPKLTGGKRYLDVPEEDFPEFIASAILAYVTHLIVNGNRKPNTPPVNFVPLFNLLHRDGAEMITIGGAFATAESEKLWRRCVTDHPAIDRDSQGNPTFQRLDLVPITLKEKIILDRCLPESEANFLKALAAAGICLDHEMAKKYRRYYRQFPVFVESSL